jgi:nucleoid-associated protein YgaU
MTRPRVRLILVVGAAALAVGGLAEAGTVDVTNPPLRSWGDAEAWYEQAGPTAVAVAALRLVALAGAGWLVLAASLQLLATVSPWRAIQSLADAASPRALRRVAQGVAGLSVTVGLAGPPAPSPGPDPAGTAVMEVLDDAGPPPTTPPPPAPAPAVPTPTAPDDEVRVAPGDSFWSIAAEVVADHPRPPAVDAYWRRLIAANRSRLVDPANPDLLFPGQALTLPAIDT